MKLINKASIENYLSYFSADASKYPLEGCVEGWFSPQDKNPNGEFCLNAATQISLGGFGTEAGPTSYHQFLLKNGSTPTFRQGAAVNIIFVSDTHDPGKASAGLIERRPDYTLLKDQTYASNEPSSFKLHAIAPNKGCSSESLHGRSYFPVVEASAGTWIDSCSATDYASVIKKMIETGSAAEIPIFHLAEAPSEIISVHLDGVAQKDFTLGNGNVLKLATALDPAIEHKIEVVYRVQ